MKPDTLKPFLLKPHTLIHHDWGISPKKRWRARATLEGGHYTADAAELVGPLGTLVGDAHCAGGAVLLGFDFPIGLPAAYARAAGVEDFRAFLESLSGESDFYRVCGHPSEISLTRPFYPRAPGGKKQVHLLEALELEHMDQLRRVCDLRQPNRPAASSLFWTLGANQSGKGAMLGWSEVLAPALRSPRVKMWPFDGRLSGLLRPGDTVIAETYPTQYHHWLFGKRLSGKAHPAIRKAVAPGFFKWAEKHQVALSLQLEQQIETGFPDGDDSLDAFIGLCGMIQTVQGAVVNYEPLEPVIRRVEGWILGQPV